MRRSDRPLTGREILKAIPSSSRVDSATLEGMLSQDPRVIPWPPRTSAAPARYWTRKPGEVVDSLLPDLLAEAALTVNDLQKKLRRPLAGFSTIQRQELVESRVTGLVAADKLFVHPPPGRTRPKYSRKPPAAGAYVGKLKTELDALAARLNAYGITREQILEALRGEKPVGDLPQRIAQYLKSRPGGIGVSQLREELGIQLADKAAFDAAVLGLYRQRRVYLDQHDYPLGLSEEARNQLVTDGSGNYFVVIGLRDADAESIP
ncbi:MAG: hypothetical protein P4L56_20915 [Candidatus Sulfopaludibacter sp.]|nr:hypothetical protein [Candidatus Sulfopaludibacter sp.]